MRAVPDVEVLIVGAGFSGIGAAVALTRGGFHDVLLVEAGDGVGGAWHWNTYPGVAVDIPSFSYQFSYAQRTDWSRIYAPGDELKAYAEWCVDRYGLRDRIRLNTRVTGGEFDPQAHEWTVALDGRPPLRARYVVGAAGVLTQPKRPELPGLEDFAGTTMHTARWDHDVRLTGRRVGIIGTGASAVQVIPAIAPEVAHLTVFQRTPIWCLPRLDAPLPAPLRAGLRWLPGARQVSRLASQSYVELTFPLAAHYASALPMTALGEHAARDLLRRQVDDPQLRDKLTPRYRLGCKRPSFSGDYLLAFNRPNVTLETDPIKTATRGGIRTATGAEHPLDVLILATGFKVFEAGNMPPFDVRGAGGADLESFWRSNRLQAYEGVSVPGFPNLFTILGPYGYNGASYFTLIENQSRHIVRCLREARRRQATWVEVTEAANARYLEQMLARRHRQVFFQGGCGGSNSYYFDEHGDVPLRPSSSLEAAWRSARFDLGDYHFRSAPVAA